jgi:pimeloyl-ACP methyl ester carboxylesterase
MKGADSPVDWKKFFPNHIMLDKTMPIYYNNNTRGPNLLCLHGAGHSALSFSLLSALSKNYRLISYDFRGHGNNVTEPKDDLSMATLVSDTEKVLLKINELFPKDNIVVLGHSLGGAVAVKTCCHIFKTEFNQDLYDKIQGIIVVDVIEGSAMESLPFMKGVIEKRQNEFNSINEAISYMSSTQIRNLQSCRVSIPPLLKQTKNAKGKKVYTWKTDLLSTEKFWEDWYKDLSKEFLSIRTPKALILTDTNELDTPLTVGHMQGKFKLGVVKGTGHFIMEDDPPAMMEQINQFCQVFRIPRTLDDIKTIKSELGNQVKVVKYVESK